MVTVVLLAAFGNDGHRLNFGIQDFLGVGTSLGLALATPLILMAYLFGGSLLVMVRRSSSGSEKLKTLVAKRCRKDLSRSSGFVPISNAELRR